jgi:putative permease
LVPLLFSDAVKLHPIIIILAVFVFGGLFGFWGVFFAIPIATLIKAIWNSWPDQISE